MAIFHEMITNQEKSKNKKMETWDLKIKVMQVKHFLEIWILPDTKKKPVMLLVDFIQY